MRRERERTTLEKYLNKINFNSNSIGKYPLNLVSLFTQLSKNFCEITRRSTCLRIIARKLQAEIFRVLIRFEDYRKIISRSPLEILLTDLIKNYHNWNYSHCFALERFKNEIGV